MGYNFNIMKLRNISQTSIQKERKTELGKNQGLEKQIDTYNNELQYDIQSKQLIGTKSVLAQIFRLCVPEFEGMEVEEIKKYILDTQVLSKEVSEGYSNRNAEQEERVLLLSSESKVEGEKTIFYDIRTIVKNPKYNPEDKNSYETMELVMNIEVQTDSKHLDYVIEQRSIYYASRSISDQLGIITKKTNYSQLNKVYSIWILLGEEGDSIRHLQLKDQDNEVVPEADLLHLMYIRLSKETFEGEKDNIFHLLHSFYDIMKIESRKKELSCYFDFSKEEELEEGVKNMANLGTYVGKQYESRGIAIGESRGILLSAKKFLEKGYSLEEIEDVLGITEEEVMNYMEQEN